MTVAHKTTNFDVWEGIALAATPAREDDFRDAEKFRSLGRVEQLKVRWYFALMSAESGR